MSLNRSGPVDREEMSTTWFETVTRSLPPFVLEALSWLGERTGYSVDPFNRHLEVISQAPELLPIPLFQKEVSTTPLLSTPINEIIHMASRALGRAASYSSSRKSYQMEYVRLQVEEFIEKALYNLLDDLTETTTKKHQKSVAEGVQKLSSAFSRTLLAETVAPPTYTQHLLIEESVRELTKPLLTVLIKRLLEVDERGAISPLLDRLVIQLNYAVSDLNKASYSLLDFQQSAASGCHPLIRTLSFEGVNDPKFRQDLETVILTHYENKVPYLFDQTLRAELFKALYGSRGAWLSNFAPDLLENGLFSKLIEDEDHFLRIAEYTFDLFIEKYKRKVVEASASALIDFTEPRHLKGLIYSTAFPPVINLLKGVLEKAEKTFPVDEEIKSEQPIHPSTLPPAYAHLINELLFGVVLRMPGSSFVGSVWEGNLNRLIATNLSFLRDDPTPLYKILSILEPVLKESLSLEKIDQMVTSQPKESLSAQKQLDDLADILIEVLKGYLPEILLPARVTLSEAIRIRIDRLFDAQWKNLNLILLLLEAI